MKKFMWISMGLGLMAFSAAAFDTEADYALLMDAETGYVMLDKQADTRMAPASMSKLMTAYLVFEALKNNQISWDDEMTVSENAWRKGGAKSGSSTMFLNPGQQVKVRDLIRGVIIQSGNDACITLAENLAGSEEVFADMMTAKGKELGLKEAVFKNATGLPHPEHKMSSRDLALLAQAIIRDFPDQYPIYSEKEFKFNGIRQENRNPLLYSVKGADGLKTGHTKESGYGLTGSVVTPDGRRLIMVLNGLKTMAARSAESKKIMGWGASAFENVTLFASGAPILDIPVWLGVKDQVAATVDETTRVTLMKGTRAGVRTIARFDTPVMAPVEKGQKLGEVTVLIPGREEMILNLVAAEDVEKVGYFGKVKAVITSWFK